jgi:hypothetical protein
MAQPLRPGPTQARAGFHRSFERYDMKRRGP